jgi:hypothetical protein
MMPEHHEDEVIDVEGESEMRLDGVSRWFGGRRAANETTREARPDPGYKMVCLVAVMVSAVAASLVALTVTASPAETQSEGDGRSTEASAGNPGSVLGKPVYSQARVAKYARSKGSTKYIMQTIPLYYELAPRVGIRPDFLVAQAMVETGYGRYGGDSRPWNMAGIKKGGIVGDEPKDFERPKTARAGVRMHINHMAAYTNRKTLGKPHDRYYDARAAQKSRGYWVKRINQLGNGVWATDPNYASKIRGILDDM